MLGPPGSALLDGAEAAGLEAVAEGFADRRYVVTGGRAALLGREHDGALLAAQDAVAQAVLIARRGVAVAPDGSEIAVAARSICLHGDTPGAAGIASAVRAALEEAGVAIEPFA